MSDDTERSLKTMCDQWAADHTHLQKLCKQAGFDDLQVFGDSYGVPSISDLADLLHSENARLRGKLEADEERIPLIFEQIRSNAVKQY